MKYNVKHIILLCFVILLITNILVIVSSIKLGDEINRFETETKNIHKENINLDRQISKISSLQYANAVAPSLDFSQKSQPMELDTLPYAMNR